MKYIKNRTLRKKGLNSELLGTTTSKERIREGEKPALCEIREKALVLCHGTLRKSRF